MKPFTVLFYGLFLFAMPFSIHGNPEEELEDFKAIQIKISPTRIEKLKMLIEQDKLVEVHEYLQDRFNKNVEMQHRMFLHVMDQFDERKKLEIQTRATTAAKLFQLKNAILGYHQDRKTLVPQFDKAFPDNPEELQGKNPKLAYLWDILKKNAQSTSVSDTMRKRPKITGWPNGATPPLKDTVTPRLDFEITYQHGKAFDLVEICQNQLGGVNSQVEIIRFPGNAQERRSRLSEFCHSLETIRPPNCAKLKAQDVVIRIKNYGLQYDRELRRFCSDRNATSKQATEAFPFQFTLGPSVLNAKVSCTGDKNPTEQTLQVNSSLGSCIEIDAKTNLVIHIDNQPPKLAPSPISFEQAQSCMLNPPALPEQHAGPVDDLAESMVQFGNIPLEQPRRRKLSRRPSGRQSPQVILPDPPNHTPQSVRGNPQVILPDSDSQNQRPEVILPDNDTDNTVTAGDDTNEDDEDGDDQDDTVAGDDDSVPIPEEENQSLGEFKPPGRQYVRRSHPAAPGPKSYMPNTFKMIWSPLDLSTTGI